MGVLEDAIREHLDLKRKHGASSSEVERLEREALGPMEGGDALAVPQAVEHPEPAAEAPEHAEDRPPSAEPPTQLAAVPPPAEDRVAPDLAAPEPGVEPDPWDSATQVVPPAPRATPSAPVEVPRPLEVPPSAVPPVAEPMPRAVEPPPPDPPPVAAADPPASPVAEPPAPQPPVAEPPPAPQPPAPQPPVAEQPEPSVDEAPPPAAVALGDDGQTSIAVPATPDDDAVDLAQDAATEGPDSDLTWPQDEPQRDADPGQPTVAFDAADVREAERPVARPAPEDDVLEETPDFLQETPEHDRLWFEQRPPRDFDFDG